MVLPERPDLQEKLDLLVSVDLPEKQALQDSVARLDLPEKQALQDSVALQEKLDSLVRLA